MGAPSLRKSWWEASVWGALCALWTYILGFFQLMEMGKKNQSRHEAHAIRIRHTRSGRLLVHSKSDFTNVLSFAPQRDSTVRHEDTIFLAIFSKASSDEAVDVMRLAAANAPNSWLTLISDGIGITIGDSVDAAANFLVTPVSDPRAHTVSLRLTGADIESEVYLSAPGSRRDSRIALAVTPDPAHTEFVLNVVPSALPRSATKDSSFAGVFEPPQSTFVRVQAVRNGAFLSAVPGERVREVRKRDAGWDVFAMEYHLSTKSATFRDSQGRRLGFTDDYCGLCAVGDGGLVERFYVERVTDGDDDDRVTLRSRKGFLSVVRGGEVKLRQENSVGRNEMFWLRLALPSMMGLSCPRKRLRNGDNGLRIVEASVEVPCEAAVAYDVITDYEGFPRFVEDAAASEVLSRHGNGRLMVRMVQSHSFLVLTLNLAMELDVREKPEENLVTMEMKKGFGVREYRGMWKATRQGEQKCVLTCEICAAPAIPAPGFLVDGVISHATEATLMQVRAECIRRAVEYRRKEQ